MDIVTRTRELHERVLALETAIDAHAEGKGLIDWHTEKLDTDVSTVERLHDGHVALTASGMKVPVPLMPMALANHVKALLERFAVSPTRATLTAPNGGWAEFQALLEVQRPLASAALLRVWQAFTKKHMPQEQPEDLRRDPGIAWHSSNQPILRLYEQLHGGLTKGCAVVPRFVADIQSFIDDAAKARELLGRLTRGLPPGEDIPLSVRAFLRDVQAGPVSLERLSSDVLEWLRANGRLGGFEIRGRSG